MRHRRPDIERLERAPEERGRLRIDRRRSPGARIAGKDLDGLELQRLDHLDGLVETAAGPHVHANSPFLGHRSNCMKARSTEFRVPAYNVFRRTVRPQRFSSERSEVQ